MLTYSWAWMAHYTPMNKRTHVVLSEQLVKDIDNLVGSRQRSSFITQAAERELMRRRQLKALDELVPWKEKDHPELKQGAARHVRKLRHEFEQRFEKVTNR
jgi:metal-responsive CopG/Arc/MetJ family transcriptional regulator